MQKDYDKGKITFSCQASGTKSLFLAELSARGSGAFQSLSVNFALLQCRLTPFQDWNFFQKVDFSEGRFESGIVLPPPRIGIFFGR